MLQSKNNTMPYLLLSKTDVSFTPPKEEGQWSNRSLTAVNLPVILIKRS